MSEQKDQECQSKCKNGNYLIMFFLFVIVVLLSGIFYTMQGMLSMCPMKSNSCATMKAAGGAECPFLTKKSHAPLVQ